MSLKSSLEKWFAEQKKMFEQARKKLAKSAEPVSEEAIRQSVYESAALKVDTEVTFDQLQQEVRELAYKKWEEAGYPEGDGQQFWVAAEEEIFGPNPLANGGYHVYMKQGKDWALTKVTPQSEVAQ